MTERRSRIAVDMDDVIAHTIDRFAEIYRKNHQIELNEKILYGKEIREVLPPELKHTVSTYVNEPGFFRHITVMPGSQKVLRELTGRYDVYIVSAAMEFKNSLIDKFEWLQEHFPFIPWTNIIFCGHKIVDVDIIIDDRIRNFVGFGGRKLLYSSSHNMLVEGYERVNNWQEIADRLL
ncbi:MAG: 5'(3')-deoxyribonucleotidase [Chitinophagaceae bacterium]|nr:5'(3')-deoxyribonucleotidase [Chitinophagaceae bacterium]